jgi:hypothetical protein
VDVNIFGEAEIESQEGAEEGPLLVRHVLIRRHRILDPGIQQTRPGGG